MLLNACKYNRYIYKACIHTRSFHNKNDFKCLRSVEDWKQVDDLFFSFQPKWNFESNVGHFFEILLFWLKDPMSDRVHQARRDSIILYLVWTTLLFRSRWWAGKVIIQGWRIFKLFNASNSWIQFELSSMVALFSQL